MNIFFLDRNPFQAAKMHHDKHVVKMILETAQLLSTAHRVLDGTEYIDASSGRRIKRYKLNDSRENVLYKATHMNHPSAVWVRKTSGNYCWTYKLFNFLLAEYTHRYGKHHKCEELKYDLGNLPKNIINDDITEIPQAMPEQYKDSDPVRGYRNYYIAEKKGQSKYTNRKVPTWLK
jgi:hypothetical protein